MQLKALSIRFHGPDGLADLRQKHRDLDSTINELSHVHGDEQRLKILKKQRLYIKDTIRLLEERGEGIGSTH